MEALVKAVSDILAAVLGRFGYVGRPRRRAAIRDDLDLLDRLRGSADFGPGSDAHRFLANHIAAEVARFAGVESRRKKPILWGSVVLALVIGVPAAYWTYTLNDDGFRFISLVPGAVAFLMLAGAVGMVFDREEVVPEDDREAGHTTPTPSEH